jgi:hypothetical protein
MTTVAQRGLVMYQNFEDHFGVPRKWPDILESLGWDDSSRSRKALEWAREHALAHGLIIPMAAACTDHTYVLTDEAEVAFEPALTVERQAMGVKKLQYKHDDFMAAHMRGLTGRHKRILKERIEFERNLRGVMEAHDNYTRLIIEQEREIRKMREAG